MNALTALRHPVSRVVASVVAIALLTGAMLPIRDDIGLLNVGLLLLLLTLLLSSIWGREAGIFSAVVANLSLNFFFIEPRHTVNVSDPANVLALFVFLLVSVIGGSLLAAAKRETRRARMLQAESEVALRLSHAMSGQTEPHDALQALCSEVASALDAPAAAVLTRDDGVWTVVASAGEDSAARAPGSEERVAADRASTARQQQGIGYSGLDGTRRPRIVVATERKGALERRAGSTVFVPLILGERVLGVLRLDGPIGETPFRHEPRRLLSAAASEAAVALGRLELSRSAAHAEALRQADELKSALMASVSHDLNTPLATIKAAISSILDPAMQWSGADLLALHRTIDSQVDRLHRVISNLLDLNRIEAGAVTPDQAVIRGVELLRKVRDMTAAETRGRELTVSGAEEPRLLADEALITQALVNLVENGARYSTPGGAIHLSVESSGEHTVLVVEDEGPGIAPQDLPHLFDRFYRSNEVSGRVRGSGLGLAIVKSFVELCGGEVTVTSSPRGTRFSLSLPAASPARIRA